MESDFLMRQVLRRYSLSGAEKFSLKDAVGLNVDAEFIFTLVKVFEDESAFCPEAFDEFSLSVIMDYIRRTHQYYVTQKLPEIEQSITILLKDYSGDHSLLSILHHFYNDYTDHLVRHIGEEENILLPYIDYLLVSEKVGISLPGYFNRTKNYSLRDFIEHHHDTELDLREVRRSILYYNPPATNQTPYRILLSQLEAFEKDLAVHALVEDKVLIPRAMKIEDDLNRLLMEKARSN